MVTNTEIRRIEFVVRELIRIGGHTGNETFFKDIFETIKKLKVMNCIKINCPAPKIGHPCDGCDVAVSTHEVIDTPESPVLIQTFQLLTATPIGVLTNECVIISEP